MPTLYTLDCGTAQDYATLQSAIDDIDTVIGSTELDTEDAEVLILVHSDSVFTERWSVTGYQTDATHRIIIRGVDPSDKPHFEPSAGTGNLCTLLNDYVIVEDLSLKQYSGASGGDRVVAVGNGSNACIGSELKWCRLDSTIGFIVDTLLFAGDYAVGSSSAPFATKECIFGMCGGAYHSSQISSAVAHYWQIVNCSAHGSWYQGIRYRTHDAGALVDYEIVNTIIFGSGGDNFAQYIAHDGTLVTTGSDGNFQVSGGNLPGLGSPNPITPTGNASPGAGDWAIVTSWVPDLSAGYSDLRPVDVADNDILGAGVGPAANALVLSRDYDGNPRSGATTTPGAFELPSDDPITGEIEEVGVSGSDVSSGGPVVTGAVAEAGASGADTGAGLSRITATVGEGGSRGRDLAAATSSNSAAVSEPGAAGSDSADAIVYTTAAVTEVGVSGSDFADSLTGANAVGAYAFITLDASTSATISLNPSSQGTIS